MGNSIPITEETYAEAYEYAIEFFELSRVDKRKLTSIHDVRTSKYHGITHKRSKKKYTYTIKGENLINLYNNIQNKIPVTENMLFKGIKELKNAINHHLPMHFLKYKAAPDIIDKHVAKIILERNNYLLKNKQQQCSENCSEKPTLREIVFFQSGGISSSHKLSNISIINNDESDIRKILKIVENSIRVHSHSYCPTEVITEILQFAAFITHNESENGHHALLRLYMQNSVLY
eukprot:208563_1